MMFGRWQFLVLLCIAPAACVSVAPEAPDVGAGMNPGSSESEPDAVGSSSTGMAEDGESTDAFPEEVLDVAIDAPGCTKIDFLFVIDDSLSMADEQARLIGGFPGFVAGIQQTVAEFDYRIMAVSTSTVDDSFDPCEHVLGAGRVRNGKGEDCGLLDDVINGKRYLDSRFDAESGALEAAFACIADVGEEGDGDERTMLAMAEALTTNDQPKGCNEGFLRDDALLVVTIISDEEDSPHDAPPLSDTDDNSPGDPEAWYDGLVGLKGGNEEAVVMLALVGDTDMPDAVCEGVFDSVGAGAEPAPRLRSLAESFTHGSWTSVCADDYAPFFNEAVASIDNACRDFVPAG